jgi:hypothetical protein
VPAHGTAVTPTGNAALVAEPVEEPARFNLSAEEQPGTVTIRPAGSGVPPLPTGYLITPGRSSYTDC